MRKPTRAREVGRGERVLPGVWRLRLPLETPRRAARQRLGAAGGRRDRARGHRDGRAAARWPTSSARSSAPGTASSDVRLIVHHPRASRPLRPGDADRRAGGLRGVDPPRIHAAPRRRATTTGSSAGWRWRARAACPRRRCAAGRSAGEGSHSGIAGDAARPTATCCPASRSRPTCGTWQVIETPGHTPSHVCLHQPERRLLISGDHLLGRVSLVFDVGYTPDPVGEFLRLAGQGRRAGRAARAGRPRAAVHRRARATSTPTARSWPSGWSPCAPRWPAARARPTTSRARSAPARGRDEMGSWLLQLTRA